MRMKHVLNSPLLRQLLAIQASCSELNRMVSNAKGDTVNDFEFSPDGGIVLIPSRQLRVEKNRAHPNLQRNVKAGVGTTKRQPFNENDDLEDEDDELFERLSPVAQGRDMERIVLSKPEKGGLGFSVVGLKSQNKGELGIFIQDVQEDGIAAR